MIIARGQKGRKNMRLIDFDAIVWHDYLVPDGNGMYHDEKIAYKSQIDDLPTAQPVITCDGCRFVSTYDTDFPCCSCVRREKDYYAPER